MTVKQFNFLHRSKSKIIVLLTVLGTDNQKVI